MIRVSFSSCLSCSLLGTVGLILGCGNPGPSDQREFEDFFQVSVVIPVKEPLSDPVIDIPSVSYSPDGSLAFPDPRAGKVRVIQPSGEVVINLGRDGEGPGEFRNPKSVAFDSKGRLYVAETSEITRFTSGLSYDSVIRLNGVGGYGEIRGLSGDRLLVNVSNGRTRSDAFRILSPEGLVTKSFFPVDSLYFEVPYWISLVLHHAAVADDRILLSSNLLYPLFLYDAKGNLLRTVGTPPGSWVQCSRPDAGEFTAQRSGRLNEWLGSFTQISGLGFLDYGVFAVVHGRFDPAVDDRFFMRDATLDIYSEEGKKISEDLPVPGPFLGTANGRIHFLTSQPPDGWEITGYSLRNEPQEPG